MAENKPELQRGLEARHIELIALGGTIGVGLFMGAASTLKWAGPSVLLAYIVAGRGSPDLNYRRRRKLP